MHTAAQPSHDWAATEPHTDFGVNANGTLNLLEAARKHAPDAPFIFTSTNKVYGDRRTSCRSRSASERLELPEDHEYYGGIRRRCRSTAPRTRCSASRRPPPT